MRSCVVSQTVTFMMKKNEKPGDYGSVQKALQILLAYLPHNQPMGTMDISQMLGLHKSTVSRLLGVLTYYDFLQQDPITKKFMLGRSAAEIGTAIRRSLKDHLVSLTQPHIDQLRNLVGETIALEVWTGDGTILAYRAEAFHMRREFLLRVGDRVDLHVSAGARVILAFMPNQIVENVLSATSYPKYTEKTITSPEILKEMLSDIRREGLAHSSGERHLDSEIFSAPVFDHEKRPVAAVSLFTARERLESVHTSEVLSALKQTAADISARLLYSENETPSR